jgi:hypothetical protein
MFFRLSVALDVIEHEKKEFLDLTYKKGEICSYKWESLSSGLTKGYDKHSVSIDGGKTGYSPQGGQF